MVILSVNRLPTCLIPDALHPPLGKVTAKEQDCSDDECATEHVSKYPDVQRECEYRGDEYHPEDDEPKEVHSRERASALKAPFHMASVGERVEACEASASFFHAHRMMPSAMSPCAAR